MLPLVAFALTAPPAPEPFTLKDGDRVVWIGNTLVEREQRYGYWETALLAAFPDKNVTFRNLGWSGDTVFGDARAGFDTPAKGFERLVSLTLELKPTVIFVSYGTNESFDGEAGLPAFEKGLNTLLDALKPAGARVVLMTPLPFEYTPALGERRKANDDLARSADAVRRTAAASGLAIADLYQHFSPPGHRNLMLPSDAVRSDIDPSRNLTDDGVHLHESGYRRSAHDFLSTLGVKSVPMDEARVEPIRRTVVAKNRLFFYRWRPQNETYLFGFRKHEQGKNAKEIVEFDPLVAAAEKDIRAALANLKK